MSDHREFYSVMFTTYEDDYKHRYDNGVYPEESELFRTEEQAEEYVTEQLYERMNERMGEWDKEWLLEKFDDDSKEFHKYMCKVHICTYHEKRFNHKKCIKKDCTEYFYKIKKQYKKDNETLEKLHNILMTGTFIEYLFDYELEKVKLH